MNKQELALQYFPDATSATAVRHLTRWIARCHPLVEALTGTGYQSRNRTFTWKQVTLIRQYLGRAIRHTLTPFRKKFFRRRT